MKKFDNNHRRITDDNHCPIINDVRTVSTCQPAYCLHFFPHFSVRPELSRRVIYIQPSNFSFVHGELVEPYTYACTCYPGFEELKRTIDSNHDNKIDRRDELFAQLQVWNDKNQDAKVQEGELHSLTEAGITSIDLNYVSTNININGNLLVEASKYTNTQGSKELAADIQLATDAKDTKVDINDIPNFSIDPITNLLPQLRGSGLVYDSLIRYNIDPEFKAVITNPIQRKAA